VPINENQTEISQDKEHQGVFCLQKQSIKDFEHEQDISICQDNLIVSSDSRQIHNDDEDISTSTNVIVDINKETTKEIKSNQLGENNKLMNENNFHEHSCSNIMCSKFDDIIFDESYTNLLAKTQPKETLLQSPSDISVNDRISDNEINTSNDGKFSNDLQSLEQYDTEENENHLVNDDILPLSPLRVQIKSDAELEDSSNNYEQNINQSSTDKQIIEDTENVSTSELKELITESTNIPPAPPDCSPSIIVTRSMIASLNLKVCSSLPYFVLIKQTN
jgi:hypothetical protein